MSNVNRVSESKNNKFCVAVNYTKLTTKFVKLFYIFKNCKRSHRCMTVHSTISLGEQAFFYYEMKVLEYCERFKSQSS